VTPGWILLLRTRTTSGLGHCDWLVTKGSLLDPARQGPRPNSLPPCHKQLSGRVLEAARGAFEPQMRRSALHGELCRSAQIWSPDCAKYQQSFFADFIRPAQPDMSEPARILLKGICFRIPRGPPGAGPQFQTAFSIRPEWLDEAAACAPRFPGPCPRLKTPLQARSNDVNLAPWPRPFATKT